MGEQDNPIGVIPEGEVTGKLTPSSKEPGEQNDKNKYKSEAEEKASFADYLVRICYDIAFTMPLMIF
jgi:hypothetical protein